jgi:hypothetical protein
LRETCVGLAFGATAYLRNIFIELPYACCCTLVQCAFLLTLEPKLVRVERSRVLESQPRGFLDRNEGPTGHQWSHEPRCFHSSRSFCWPGHHSLMMLLRRALIQMIGRILTGESLEMVMSKKPHHCHRLSSASSSGLSPRRQQVEADGEVVIGIYVQPLSATFHSSFPLQPGLEFGLDLATEAVVWVSDVSCAVRRCEKRNGAVS